ncbi:MAG TPA: (d)CMP kinase [Acidimicrobiia bacterium]|nr:(d)CMP kinase [Acidimicrobiia bacterium]
MSTIIAIDGPSGSGKSTVARAVADALGLEMLDTGAMYRAVTVAVLDQGTDLQDVVAVAAVARAADIELGERVRLNGRDVTAEIRTPEVTANVSTVSAYPDVRSTLVAHQRAWAAAHGGGVAEGRDIGTVVFPDATVKVFLTASDEERARRRQLDEEAARRSVDVEQVRSDLARRDALDSQRAASPLRIAPDALVIDSTQMSVDDVVAEVVRRVHASEEAR